MIWTIKWDIYYSVLSTVVYVHWKNSIAKRTIFWSSEPENIAIRPMLRYGPQNYTSIGETAIQVRWYDKYHVYGS